MRLKVKRLFGQAVAIALIGLGAMSASAMAAGGGGDDGGSDQTQSVPPVDPNYAGAVKAIEAKDYATGLTLLAKVVRGDAKNADAWNYIGYADRMTGKFDESLDAYKKALALKPDHLGANEYLGELYVQTGNTEMAKAQLAKLEKLCGGNCDEYRQLAKAISTGKAASLDRPGSSKDW